MAAVPALPAHCCCSATRARSGWRPRLALRTKRTHGIAECELLRNSSASRSNTSQRQNKFTNTHAHNSSAESTHNTSRDRAQPSDARSSSQELPVRHSEDTAVALGQVVQLISVKRLTEARLLCEAVVRRDRTCAQAQFLLGVLCTNEGDHKAAEACYRQACALDPCHAAAHVNLGQTLSVRGAALEAVRHLRTAVQLAPAQFEAHLNLAVALSLAKQPQHARAAAADALRLSPSSATASILLGEIELEIGHDAGALARARRAVTLVQAQTPSQPTAAATRAAAHTLLGAALSARGDFSGALNAYAAALEAAPAHAAAHAGRAHVAAPALRCALSPKRGDVFIATFPKSGTTWVQKIVCMLFGEPASVDVQRRAPWAEGAVASGALSLAELNALSPPRIFKTHAVWPALPVAGCRHSCIPSGVRVICVVRDPRDVMVSLYHHSRAIKAISWTGSWDEWFDAFLNGRAPLPGASLPSNAQASECDGGDWFSHTRAWWSAAQTFREQVLWISYESMHADMPAAVRRIGDFLRRPQADVEARLEEIVHECSFGVMKMQHESGPGRLGAALRNQNEAAHFRRGTVGGWRAYFTEAQRELFASSWRDRAAGIGMALDLV